MPLIQHGQYLTWDAVKQDWVPTTPPDPSGGAYDAVFVRKDQTSDQVMAGRLVVPDNGLLVGTNQLVAANGNVGIGTTNPTQKFHVETGNVLFNNAAGWVHSKGRVFIGTYQTPGAVDGTDYSQLHIWNTVTNPNLASHQTGLTIYQYISTATNTLTTQDVYGIRVELADLPGSTGNIYGIQGFRPYIVHLAASTMQQLLGWNGRIRNQQTLGTMWAMNNSLENTGAISGNMYGYRASVTNSGSVGGSIYMHNAEYLTVGTVTGNVYGFHSGDMSVHPRGWNFFSIGATSRNYFQGSVGIGTTVLTYALNVNGDVSATNFRGNGSTLTGVEPTVASGLTSDYYRGDKTWQNLNTTVVVEGLNLYYTQARFNTAFAAKSTTDLAEGTNLYWTQTRFNTAFGGKTTTDLAEGTNLYWTQTRFNAAFAGKSTTDLAEGTNLYFTTGRARASVSGTSNQISYNSTTGVFSLPSVIGIGTTSVAGWTSHQGVLESVNTSIFFGQVTDLHVLSNAYSVVSGTGWQYKTSNPASDIFVYNGTVQLRVAASGTANTSLTWNTQLYVDNTGVAIASGSSSGYKLYVNGSSYFNGAQTINGDMLLAAATSNLYMKDTSTGFTVGTSTVVNLLNGATFRSSNYASGISGFNISSNGSAEFENILARGEFRASVFKIGEISATGGTIVVSTGASTLTASLTTPAIGASFTFSAKKSDAGGALFSVGNVVLIRSFNGSAVTQLHATVTAVNNSGTDTVVTATFNAGTVGATYSAGTAIVNLGSSGAGQIWLSSDGTVGSSPNITMSSHAGSPWLSSPILSRIGNLRNSYGYPDTGDIHGFAAGQYGVANMPWITVTTADGIRIGGGSTGTATLGQWDTAGNILVGNATGSNVYITSTGLALRGGSTARIQLNTDGSGWLANSSISWTTGGVLTVANNATIANWAVSSTAFTNGGVKIAAGSDLSNVASTAETWIGRSSTGYMGVFLKGTTTAYLSMIAGNTGVSASGRPYIELHDGARRRIIIGELNTTIWDGVATNSLGMKIWSSGGTKLVEFSDITNSIANWTLTATSLTNSEVTISAGTALSFTAGTPAIAFGKFSSGHYGIYFKGTGGTDANFGIAQYTGVGPTQRPYMFFYDGSKYKIVLGELNTTAWNSDPASAGLGMKIWNSAGTKIVEFSDDRNIISNWNIGAGILSNGSTILAANTGANDAIGSATASVYYFGSQSSSAGGGAGLYVRQYNATTGLSKVVQLFSGQNGVSTTGATRVMDPHLAMSDGTRWRVVIGDLNNPWAGGATGYRAATGIVIWDQSGNRIFESSDNNHFIAGWGIAPTYLAYDTGVDATSAGMAPADYPFFAGKVYASRSSAPFRVTNSGSVFMSSATISGATFVGSTFTTGGSAPSTTATFGGTGSSGVLPIAVFNGSPGIGFNVNLDPTSVPRYIMSGYGARLYMRQFDGNLVYAIGGSGSPGGAPSDTTRLWIENAGSMGFNTASPIFDPNSPATFFLFHSANTGNAEIGIGMNQSNTSSPVGQLCFVNTNLGGTEKRVAAIVGATDGATNSGGMTFWIQNAGSWNASGAGSGGPTMKIDKRGGLIVYGPNGQVMIGSNLAVTTGENTIELFMASSTVGVLRVHSPNVSWRSLNINPYGGNLGIRLNSDTIEPSYVLHLGVDSAAKPSSNVWTVTSDRRTKMDIQPFSHGLDVIRRLEPKTWVYNGKADTKKGDVGVGFVAQELLGVYRRMTRVIQCRMSPGDSQDSSIYAVNTNDLTYMIVNALKELDRRLLALEMTPQEGT